jgi:hypothetical protein
MKILIYMNNPSKEDYGELQKVKILEFMRFAFYRKKGKYKV